MNNNFVLVECKTVFRIQYTISQNSVQMNFALNPVSIFCPKLYQLSYIFLIYREWWGSG
jgi:hypothetical protein